MSFSAHLQDAILVVGDMAFLSREKRFAAIASRFDWVTAVKDGAKGDEDYLRRRSAPAAPARLASSGPWPTLLIPGSSTNYPSWPAHARATLPKSSRPLGFGASKVTTLSADLAMPTFDRLVEPFERGAGPAGAYVDGLDARRPAVVLEFQPKLPLEYRVRDLEPPDDKVQRSTAEIVEMHEGILHPAEVAALHEEGVEEVTDLLRDRPAGEQLEAIGRLEVRGGLAVGIALRVEIQPDRERNVLHQREQSVAGRHGVSGLFAARQPVSVRGEVLTERGELGKGLWQI